MSYRNATAWLAALFCALGLAACAGPTDTSFPAHDLATTPNGTFPNVDNLRMVDIGMTKDQVYPLIGPPHFHESVFHVRVWNYLFYFHTPDKTVSCDFQIQFDDRGRVTRTRWGDEACNTFAAAKMASDVKTGSITENVQ